MKLLVHSRRAGKPGDTASGYSPFSALEGFTFKELARASYHWYWYTAGNRTGVPVLAQLCYI